MARSASDCLSKGGNFGVTPVQIKEILYQSVPYVGMAKAFEFLHATNEVLTSRGISLPLEIQSTTTAETRYEKGLAAQKAIFGNMIDQLYEQSPKDQLHIQRFLSAHCFGDHYTRNGLDLKLRELVTLSILIALGGVESPIKGHIQGNLNVGNLWKQPGRSARTTTAQKSWRTPFYSFACHVS